MSEDNPFEQEYVYIDVDEDGEIPAAKKKSMMEKAREGKTDLQRTALAATGRHYFGTSQQHKAFRQYEDKAMGADPESRMWAAWLSNRIKLAEKYRTTMDKLIASFDNRVKRDNWFADNRAKVLVKPTVTQLVGVMVDKMEKLQHADDTTDDM